MDTHPSATQTDDGGASPDGASAVRHRQILFELAGQATDRTEEALATAMDDAVAEMAEYLEACEARSLARALREAARMVSDRTESPELRELAAREAEDAELAEREAAERAEALAADATPHIEHWRRLALIQESIEKIHRGRG